MTVNEAIAKIHAPKGLTSILDGLANNDYSVLPHEKGIGADFEKAEAEVTKYQKKIDECKSDSEYWSILSDLEYWKAIRNILEAGNLNDGVLADVEAPDLKNCVVMDAIGKVAKFGEEVLNKTRELANLKN